MQTFSCVSASIIGPRDYAGLLAQPKDWPGYIDLSDCARLSLRMLLVIKGLDS